MLPVVLDTNVLVSALWTPAGNCSVIVGMVLAGKLIPCFDNRILHEYRSVLSRPRLAFPSGQVQELLAEINGRGLGITVSASAFPMNDESDRKFFDVAKTCEAYLITGNTKHYPKDPLVLSPAGFFSLTQ